MNTGQFVGQGHQGEGLLVVVALVQSRGAAWQLVLQQHVPVTDRDILQFVEGIDGGLDIPHRTEIARDLLLNGGGHGRQLRQRDFRGDGDRKLCEVSM